MVTIYTGRTYHERQILALNEFYLREKSKDDELDFETAFMMWLTNGFAEKFRHLYLVSKNQYN